MDKGIHTPVVLQGNPDNHEIEVRWEEGSDVIDFYLDGKQVFGGDWTGNFKKLFEALLKEVK